MSSGYGRRRKYPKPVKWTDSAREASVRVSSMTDLSKLFSFTNGQDIYGWDDKGNLRVTINTRSRYITMRGPRGGNRRSKQSSYLTLLERAWFISLRWSPARAWDASALELLALTCD